MSIDKTKLIKAVQNDEAEFIREEHIEDDIFELYFEYEGVTFSMSAHGNERWLMEDPDFVTVVDEIDKNIVERCHEASKGRVWESN